jgi:probable HAF family extracellular repeat protein
MKSRTLTCITAMTLFTVLAFPLPLVAQEQKKVPPRYSVIDLGTLGGSFSQAFGINNNGTVVGFATLSDAALPPLHAFLWRKGVMTDLSTLAPTDVLPYSVAFSINNNDEIVGYSETSVPDPQNTCGDSLVCLPVLWRDGLITALPTLGGTDGQASAINNRGQVVGSAQTDKTDPTCQNPVLKPTLWEGGEARALPTAPFRDGIVGANNNKGQVVGNVVTCNFSAGRAYLWEKNKVINMGTLGGLQLSPTSINNEGQATGSYTTTAGIDRGFLWQNGVAMDLGALPGYPVIHGNNINDRGQIVGQACKSVSMQHCTVFLWQNGVKIDLNTVVPASSSLHMFDPGGINSRGEIVGLAIEKPTGQLRAFLATPCDEEHANEEGCEDGAEATTAARGETSQDPKLVIPENVRKVLLQRWGFGRFASSPQNVTLSDTAAASRPNVTLSPTSLTLPTQVIGKRQRFLPGRGLWAISSAPRSSPASPLRVVRRTFLAHSVIDSLSGLVCQSLHLAQQLLGFAA